MTFRKTKSFRENKKSYAACFMIVRHTHKKKLLEWLMMNYKIKMMTNKKRKKAQLMSFLKKMNSPKRRKDRERQISCTERRQKG